MHDLRALGETHLRRQAGLITRPQLRGLGLREAQVDGLVARHRLERVVPGLYRVHGDDVPTL